MKIKIHESLLILFVLALLAGYIEKLLIVYILVLIHELGHILMCKYFNRKVSSFTVIPFGGVVEFENDCNKPLIEEILIIAIGPIINILILLIMLLFGIRGLAYQYNIIILVFNLIPIFPLDGGRLFEVFLMKYLSFNKAIFVSFCTSIMIIITVFIYCLFNFFSLGLFFVLGYLLYKNIVSFRNRRIRYYSFLTKKYLYPNPKLHIKYLSYYEDKIINYFFKGVNNNLGTKEKFVEEEKVLARYFKKNEN